MTDSTGDVNQEALRISYTENLINVSDTLQNKRTKEALELNEPKVFLGNISPAATVDDLHR